MGSKHHSLQMSELADVTDLLYGFEKQNECVVICTFQTEGQRGKLTIVLTMHACSVKPVSVERADLASVSVICSDLNLKTWNAALTHALYALDFQLALNEMQPDAAKKA